MVLHAYLSGLALMFVYPEFLLTKLTVQNMHVVLILRILLWDS